MPSFSQDLSIVVDGVAVDPGLQAAEPLVRAVVISLFTWRRARPDDALPGSDRFGWWGDNFAAAPNDRIGSRLWLLAREKILPRTLERAREYAEEALQWLIDDGVASRVEVEAERQGLTTVALACRIYRTAGGAPVDLRFANAWDFLHAV